MKTICHALFALSALLIASCSKQTSDIIEWSTNGVTGVRMPLHVTFVENVQVEESAMQDAIDRKSTRLNSSHIQKSRMPSSA